MGSREVGGTCWGLLVINGDILNGAEERRKQGGWESEQ